MKHICNVCKKSYSSQSALRIHELRHKPKEELPFQCMFCSYKSAAKRDLLRHHNLHIGHARPVYKCQHCDKIFKLSSSLNEHIQSIHIQDKIFNCEKCSYTATRRSNLRNHQKLHAEEIVKFICSICMSPFKNKNNLKVHLITHADAKPCGCTLCDKKFKLNSRLLAHHRVVHSPKSFECSHCQKLFSSTNALKRHSLTHTGEKPFQCCFCPTSSNTQGNIVKHVRRVHNIENMTFKEIDMRNGRLKDPLADLNPDKISDLVARGRAVSEAHINRLKERGLTSFTLDHLEQDSSERRKEKIASRIRGITNKEVPVLKKASKPAKATSSTRKSLKKKKSKDKSLSNCDDLLLPRIDGNPEVMGEFATTPTIHVMWDMSGIDITDNQLKLNTKIPKKRIRKKVPILKKSNKVNLGLDITNEQTSLECLKARNLNSASNVVEEQDCLTLQTKLSHDQEIQTTSHVLSTPVTNVPSECIDFDSIESSSSGVISSDPINSDLDPVYKNLDCGQFLNIEEDGTSFMNALESFVYQKESKKEVVIDPAVSDSKFVDKNAFTIKIPLTPKTELINKSSKLKKSELNRKNRMEKAKNILPKRSGENLKGEVNSNSSFNVDSCEVQTTEIELDKSNSESITLFNDPLDSDITYDASYLGESTLETEIIIKDSNLNSKLFNQELDITAIAEVQCSSSDVVLILDSSS